jgi:hypothetical protein
MELGQSPLANLTIVKDRRLAKGYADDIHGRAKALRDVLRNGIRALGVPDEAPPSSETDQAWLTRDWRAYSILILRFIRGLSRAEVQYRIGLAEGGRYYQEQRNAIAMLVTLLRDWEGYPEGESSPIAIEYPSGAVRLSDTFYIPRKADTDLLHEIRRPGRTITITGPRQVGKTSLLVRGVQEGIQAYKARVVYIDMQAVSQENLITSDRFLREFADWIVDDLDIDGDEVEKAWRSRLSAPRKLTKLIERHVLSVTGTPIIFALDEIDRLLLTPFHTDFFGLLRSWHNLRSRNAQWDRLSLIMAISTEPYLLINDLQQSPFNVGLMLYLDDFDENQVRELNQRYGSPVADTELPKLVHLLAGHPYLTRVALYTMVKDQVTLSELVQIATTERGPFISHLRYQRQLIAADQALGDAIKQVLDRGQCSNELARYRLLKAGLIRQMGAAVACRCELYRLYFANQP